MDLKKLRHFVAVARLLSFSRAAESLNITQSALSRSIQALEAQYAARLFDRSRAGVHLTANGQELAELANKLLRAAGSVEQHFLDAGSNSEGNLAFGMAPLPAKIFLSKFVPHVLGWRCARINAAVQRTETLLTLLLSGELEFLVAPAFYVSLSKLIDVEEFAQVSIRFFVRKTHPLNGSIAVTMEDLRKYPMMTTGRQGELFSPEAIFGRPFIVTDNVDAAVQIVQQSEIVYLSGPEALADEIANESLVPLTLVGESIPDTVLGLFTLKHRELGPLADRSVERIKDIAQEMGIRAH